MSKRILPIYLLLFGIAQMGNSQELASFSSLNSTGCSGVIANDPNLTTTGMCRGSGIAYKAGASYNSKNWTTGGSIDGNDYVEWTITPNGGYSIDFTTLDIAYSRSAQGPTQAEIQIDTGSGFTTIFSDANVTTAVDSNTGIDLSAYTSIVSTVTFRYFAYGASNTNGTLAIEEHTPTNKGIIIHGSIMALSCSTNATWNGSNWSPSVPDASMNAIIDGDYNTGNGGSEVSFNACNLTINSGHTLTIDDMTYISIENDVTVDGHIVVESQGAFIQESSTGVLTVNPGGTTRVNKTSANLNHWYEYTYWSAPVSGATVESTFSNTPVNRRFWYNAQNYLDSTREVGNNNETKPGQDDVDDDNNDWQLATGVMTIGNGYAATSSESGEFPRTDDISFVGDFNTGDVVVPIYKNDAETKDNNWNLIGNPYPSAINVDDFLIANASVIDEAVTVSPSQGGLSEGAIFIWSQGTPPSNSNNGNEKLNFSQSDYAILNLTSQVAGGDGVIPNRYIPSGQAFFISYDHAAAGTEISPGSSIKTGNVTFTNGMRMADGTSNSQFFRGSGQAEANRLWINLTSDQGVFSQVAIGYVENATNGYDGMLYDAARKLSSKVKAMIYTSIQGQHKKFAIEGRDQAKLNSEERISLGFQTSIESSALYTLSVAQFRGSFFESNQVFIKDRLLNRTHDLSTSDYTFRSRPGDFKKRFEIVFSRDSEVDNGLKALPEVSIIDAEDGFAEIKVTASFTMETIELYDLAGRLFHVIEVPHLSTTRLNLSNLDRAGFIVKVRLSDGRVIVKKALSSR